MLTFMNKMFEDRTLESPALVVRAVESRGDDCHYTVKQVKGDFVRVYPNTWREICYLQTLEKGYNLFAPWNGDGVLVMAKYLPH